MNVILAVTNERFIAESFFSQFYPNNILQKILPNIGKSSGNVFAEWKTIVNGEEQNNWIPEDILTLDFNIVYVPYQGLAYIVHRERELNRIDGNSKRTLQYHIGYEIQIRIFYFP